MIKRVRIPKYTQEWYDWRRDGYGASEISAVLAEYNADLLAELPGGSPIEVHLDKIGEGVNRFNGNTKSKAGQMMEEVIIELYRYWDHSNPTSERMYDLEAEGTKMNVCKSASFTYTNDDYPHLYYSPDGAELVEVDGKFKEVGQLECKNTTSYMANKYVHGVSPTFLIQVCQGLLISQMEYARILVFVDGWELRVVTLRRDDDMVKEIQKAIVIDSLRSWKRVLEARLIKEKYGIQNYYKYNVDFLTADQQEGATILQGMEPDFTGTESEYKFVKDNIFHTEEITKMEVTPEQWNWLMERKPTKDTITEMQAKARLLDQELIHSLGGYHVAVIGKDTEEERTAFSYKADKNEKYSIRVSAKIYE